MSTFCTLPISFVGCRDFRAWGKKPKDMFSICNKLANDWVAEESEGLLISHILKCVPVDLFIGDRISTLQYSSAK